MTSDRIERMAKEYAQRKCADLSGRCFIYGDEIAMLENLIAESFRSGASAGAAEAGTSRSPMHEADFGHDYGAGK